MDTVTEIVFVVEEAPEGGYTARAVGVSIVTEAEDMPALRTAVRSAVRCHFEAAEMPKLIRLQPVGQRPWRRAPEAPVRVRRMQERDADCVVVSLLVSRVTAPGPAREVTAHDTG